MKVVSLPILPARTSEDSTISDAARHIPWLVCTYLCTLVTSMLRIHAHIWARTPMPFYPFWPLIICFYILLSRAQKRRCGWGTGAHCAHQMRAKREPRHARATAPSISPSHLLWTNDCSPLRPKDTKKVQSVLIHSTKNYSTCFFK
jgi:hypothetical protein